MHFSAHTSPQTVGFLLLILIPVSIASSGPTHLQLRCKSRGTVEKQALLGPLASLFSKRDDCGTQFGPTYVDCGRDGCYQPSLGELCCSDESTYCLAGTYCLGLECCPNGLTAACCDLGEGCPANVSDYFTTASSTLTSQAPTYLPVSTSTLSQASTTSTKTSTSLAAAPSTSSLSSPSSAPATPKSTSSVVPSTTATAGVTSSTSSTGAAATSRLASAAKEKALELGFGTAALTVLWIVGFVAGLM